MIWATTTADTVYEILLLRLSGGLCSIVRIRAIVGNKFEVAVECR